MRFISRQGLIGLVVVLAVLAGPIGVMARLQATLDGPSPAQDHAQVIAQGVAGMPGDQVAWRVVVDEAEALDVAELEGRALGFALADADAIVVNDVTYGTQTRLAPGEASFVADGVLQQRASLGDQTVNYERLALVPADAANDDGGDQLVFAGDGFAAPDGNRDIDLVRGVLQQDDTTSLDDSGYPVLILVTAGELEVSDGSGEPQTLTAGEAAEFSGDLDLTGTDSGETAFVAAVIGPEVPAPPRFFGTIGLGVYACPVGVTADDLDNPADPASTGCEPVTEGFDVSLLPANGDELPLADTRSPEAGSYVWDGLAFGDYEIGEPSQVPAGTSDQALYDVDGNPLDSGEITIDRQTPDVRVNLYLFSDQDGSVTVHVLNCPPGMTADDLDADLCDPATEGFDLRIELFEGDGQGDALTLDDATEDAGGYTWSGIDLPTSGETRTLGLHQPTLPDGFNDYVVVGPDGPLDYVEDAAGPAYFSFDLSLETPGIQLNVYNFQPGEGATTGDVSITAYLCPAADATDDECIGNGTYPIADILVVTPGEDPPLTLDNATADGDTLRWSGLTLGAYGMSMSNIAFEGDVSIDRVLGVTGGAGDQFGFVLTEDNPNVDVQIMLIGAEVAPTPEDDDAGDDDTGDDDTGNGTGDVDSDGDGLTDLQETDLGTDPTAADSDGDCTTDGAEVEAGTDPLDANDGGSCE